MSDYGDYSLQFYNINYNKLRYQLLLIRIINFGMSFGTRATTQTARLRLVFRKLLTLLVRIKTTIYLSM